jgi:WD40 repeat protein
MIRFLIVILFFATTAHAQSLQTVLQQGHELAALSVAISSDTNYIATGSRDKSAKLWEVATGREVRSFLGHDLSVTAMDFTPDGKYLLTGSSDKTVRWWDVMSGQELGSLNVNYRVTGLRIDPQNKFVIVSGYQTEYTGRANQWDDSVVVVDFKTRKPLKKLHANPDKGLGYGVHVAISPDGQWVATGEDDRTAHLFRTSDWKQVYEFKPVEGFCGGCGTKVAFSSDSKIVFVAANKGELKKFSVNDGRELAIITSIPEEVTALATSDDGKKIAVSTEQDVSIWNIATGKELARLAAPEKSSYRDIRFTGNSKQLVVAADNNTAFLWEFATNKKALEFTGLLNMRDKGGLNYDPNFYWQSNIAKYVRFKNTLLLSRDGKSLVKGKFGTKVKRWDVASGKAVMEYTGHKKAVLCYDLTKDGKRMVTGGGDGKIILWDFETGDSLKTIASYREPIFDIHFSNDEKRIVSSSWDATMKIHDLATTTLEKYFEFESNSAYNCLFSNNDLYLFSSRLDNSLQMWEIDTQQPVRTFIGHKDNIASMKLSADGQSLLSASWDASIRLWDVSTGLMDKKLLGHKGPVHVAIFNSDGKSIFSGGADRTIRQWDLSTSKVVRTFEGHMAEVTALLISPDNKMLITHSVDGVTKFWDLQTGKEFFEHLHFGDNEWMVKNPDGYFNGTDGARQFIHFVDGMKTYGADQFFEEFFRPDLLPKIFQNRGGDEREGIQGKLQGAPPPDVRVAFVPSSDPTQGDVLVKITDKGGGVETLKVFHNGKSVPIDRTQLQLPKGNGQSTTYKHVVTLVGGQNSFTASATNKDKVESGIAATEHFSELTTRSSICYLMAVGIDQYKNPKMSLNYAKADAVSFTDIVNNKGSLFKQVELHTLYDQDASRANILKKLEELAGKIHPEDVFVFYYAGHGSFVDNQFFFIPSESLRLYDIAALKNEAIEASVLQEKLKHIKALKQLIIMDACQSGGAAELLGTRGAAEEKALAQLSRSAGIHVMASAGTEQFATEFAELGHGLFTWLLIKALQGDADGAPKDGKVTIYELKSYLDDQVPEMTRKMKGKPQYPNTFSRGQDFPVVIDN